MPHTKDLNMLPHFILVTLIVVVAGCSRPSSERLSFSGHATESASRIMYQCKSGAAIYASYPSVTTVIVEYENQTLQMARAVSASGVRYVGGGMEWWTKGAGLDSEGTLRRDARGDTGEVVERCEQRNGAS